MKRRDPITPAVSILHGLMSSANDAPLDSPKRTRLLDEASTLYAKVGTMWREQCAQADALERRTRARTSGSENREAFAKGMAVIGEGLAALVRGERVSL